MVDRRPVAFDSNILTYFLDGNRGSDRLSPDDPIADQRVAAVRLFLYCSPYIAPTVRREALKIRHAAKLDEHMRFISHFFNEILLEDHEVAATERRAAELLAYHRNGDEDCRVVAEVEAAPWIPVLVTFDTGMMNLQPHARIRIETATACFSAFGIPRGTPPRWTPDPPHPLANETGWHWT